MKVKEVVLIISNIEKRHSNIMAMVKLFVNVTPNMIDVAPAIVHLSFLLFILIGVTVLSADYLQFIMDDKMSMLNVMPISEVIVAVIGMCYIRNKVDL